MKCELFFFILFGRGDYYTTGYTAPPALPDVGGELEHTAPPTLANVAREPGHSGPPVLLNVAKEPRHTAPPA